MVEEISERIHKKLNEDNMQIYSRDYKELVIYNMRKSEYDAFILFIQSNTPNKKGYEAIQILMDRYEMARQMDKLLAYIDELEAKVKSLETEKVEEKPKKKIIGGVE
jgi:hypothetical protein